MRVVSVPGTPHRKTPPKLMPIPPSPQSPYTRSKPPSRVSSPRGGKRSGLEDFRNRDVARSSPFLHVKKETEIDFDSFMMSISSEPVWKAIEDFFCKNLKITNAIFWEENSSTQSLTSMKLEKTVKHGQGLVGSAFFARSIRKIDIAEKDPNFDSVIDPLICSVTSAIVFVPLFDSSESLVGLVQLIRRTNESDIFGLENLVTSFQTKFKCFSKWILQTTVDENIVVDLLQLMDTGQFMLLLQKKMENIFACNSAEIWEDRGGDTVHRFGKTVKEIERKKCGIIKDVFRRDQIFNCMESRQQSSYDQEIDGPSGPIMAIPVSDATEKTIYVIVLRGHKNGGIFSDRDGNVLRKLSQIIITGFCNAKKNSSMNSRKRGLEAFANGFASTLPVAGVHSMREHTVSNSMKVLITLSLAERGTFYAVDYERNEVKSIYAKGLTDDIRLKIGQGHAGIAAQTGKVINTFDATKDSNFCKSIDLKSGFKTKSLLTVPIANSRGIVIAVVQLLNKAHGKPFSRIDEETARMMGTIIACVTENESLSSKLDDLTAHANSVIGLSECETVGDILKVAKEMLHCEGVGVYLNDKAAGVAVPLETININKEALIDLNSGVVRKCIDDQAPFYSSDTLSDPRLENFAWNEPDTHSFYVGALMSGDSVIGLFKVVNKHGLFSQTDIDFLKIYTKMLSMTLEKSALEKRIDKSQTLDVVERYVSRTETRQTAELPKLLRLPEDHIVSVQSLDYCTLDADEQKLLQIACEAFSSFGITKRYGTENGRLVDFLVRVRENFTDVPFRNWARSIDVLQFIMYAFAHANLISIMRPAEVLAITLAGLFSFVGCRGTNNKYEATARTEIGCLYRENKILQLDKCATLINLIRTLKPFPNMDELEQQNAWQITTKLMLMSEIEEDDGLEPAKRLKKILQESMLDLSNDDHRVLLLTLCFRTAILSVYCRPFETAERWRLLEMEEMFLLGKREMEEKLPLSCQFNVKNQYSVAKLATERAKTVIPLLEAVTLVLADLKPVLENALANFEKWTTK